MIMRDLGGRAADALLKYRYIRKVNLLKQLPAREPSHVGGGEKPFRDRGRRWDSHTGESDQHLTARVGVGHSRRGSVVGACADLAEFEITHGPAVGSEISPVIAGIASDMSCSCRRSST